MVGNLFIDADCRPLCDIVFPAVSLDEIVSAANYEDVSCGCPGRYSPSDFEQLFVEYAQSRQLWKLPSSRIAIDLQSAGRSPEAKNERVAKVRLLVCMLTLQKSPYNLSDFVSLIQTLPETPFVPGLKYLAWAHAQSNNYMQRSEYVGGMGVLAGVFMLRLFDVARKTRSDDTLKLLSPKSAERVLSNISAQPAVGVWGTGWEALLGDIHRGVIELESALAARGQGES